MAQLRAHRFVDDRTEDQRTASFSACSLIDASHDVRDFFRCVDKRYRLSSEFESFELRQQTVAQHLSGDPRPIGNERTPYAGRAFLPVFPDRGDAGGKRRHVPQIGPSFAGSVVVRAAGRQKTEGARVTRVLGCLFVVVAGRNNLDGVTTRCRGNRRAIRAFLWRLPCNDRGARGPPVLRLRVSRPRHPPTSPIRARRDRVCPIPESA